jgi:hypothetical protein
LYHKKQKIVRSQIENLRRLKIEEEKSKTREYCNITGEKEKRF